MSLDISWIAGKYDQGEINSAYGYVALGDYFSQGEEAYRDMETIRDIWEAEGCDQQEAVNLFLMNL